MMPVELDDTDVAILNSLMNDGRKSFRAISREIKVSTPTVKSRYQRLVNIGLIMAVRPEINVSIIDKRGKATFRKLRTLKNRGQPLKLRGDRIGITLKCELCGGPIHDKPKILKFATFERFFCCTQCRAAYKEKHRGRIEMLEAKHKHQ
ncbi:MAG TPA: AsnC family transcriptional regulator [Nitrososphaera sp.]|jgi:Lrp/AsnC family leucine-responsive transcriptional regulator